MVLFYFNLVNYPVPGVPGICSSSFPLPGLLLIPVIKLAVCWSLKRAEWSPAFVQAQVRSAQLPNKAALCAWVSSSLSAGWQSPAAFLLCPHMMALGWETRSKCEIFLLLLGFGIDWAGDTQDQEPLETRTFTGLKVLSLLNTWHDLSGKVLLIIINHIFYIYNSALIWS